VRVALLITCLGDVFFPEVGEATVRLLRRLGVDVEFPPGQTCCGQPHFNSGYLEEARLLARHTIRTFAGGLPVVVPSGSCTAMIREYPELFREDPLWHDRAEELAARTHELSDFLVNVLRCEDVGARFPARLAYHMSCHLRSLGQFTEPLRLLAHVRDLELVPLKHAEECCGFGGSFAVRFPLLSGAMGNDKINCLLQSGAEGVVATDAGCLMHLAGCLHRRGLALPTWHLAQVLAQTG
jgi:L-lactate dehydrogenase complex protein LldE